MILILLISEAMLNFSSKNFNGIYSSLNCLCYFLNNISIIVPEKITQDLKQLNLIEDIFNLIEENNEFIYKKVAEHYSNNCLYFWDANELEKTLLNQLIYFILSLNSKFSLPEENMVLQFLINSDSQSKDYSIFSENIVYLFNLEEDPLSRYKFQNSERSEQTLYNNCLIKIVSDLFSFKQAKKSTILIDVIIRKLNNLSASDQIRSDYLSLMQLIINNSCYLEQMYKIEELLSCFNMILNEKDQYTIDQDIVRHFI
ncbi:NCK-interacting with SH3 domain [Brachionus plicatilis]|uniref:NCK-interacting with SH3 domain n=1 Tax=Brachionus plicatilis TaxID=10195 RepID=A0A3M7QK65_BRAPC|nr:NCK-interacting with SH3 domain [Brachionus plicatilis]